MCDELKQANKIIKKLHDSNQEQSQKVFLTFSSTRLSKTLIFYYHHIMILAYIK